MLKPQRISGAVEERLSAYFPYPQAPRHVMHHAKFIGNSSGGREQIAIVGAPACDDVPIGN